MILQAFGIPFASPVQTSEVLSQLKLSHSVCGALGAKFWQRNIDCYSTQPAWPVVVDKVSTAARVPASKWPRILFVCDSPSALSQCNVLCITECTTERLSAALKLATAQPVPEGWKLQRNEPTILDYVQTATKPSYLNHIQTALYRITPYALRKDVQYTTIAFLDGQISLKTLRVKLKSNYKLAELLELVGDPKAEELRRAVARFKATNMLDETAKEFNVETFEILYVVNSAKRNAK